MRRSRCAPARGSRAAGSGVPTPKCAVKWKSLPTPGWLWTPISPSISSTSLRQMTSPRPVPPYSRVLEVSTCENGRNSVATWLEVRPMPESSTAKRSTTEPPALAAFCNVTTTTISPVSANFTALLQRLTST